MGLILTSTERDQMFKKILLYTLGYLFTISVMVTLGMLILHTWAVS